MTVCLAGIAIIVTGGAASPLLALSVAGSAAPTATIAAAGATGIAATTATGSTVIGAAAIGAQAAAGAIVSGATVEVAVGAGTVIGLGAVGTGAATTTGAGIVGSIIAAPVAPILVGCNSRYSFDCWKAVVHDTSEEPSQGRPLDLLLNDVTVVSWSAIPPTDGNVGYPIFYVTNQWEETFLLSPVEISMSDEGEDNMMTYHASILK